MSIVHFCVTGSKVVNFIPLNHHLYRIININSWWLCLFSCILWECEKNFPVVYELWFWKNISIFYNFVFLYLKVNLSYCNIQYDNVDINVWVLVLQLLFRNLFYDRAKICETLEVELRSVFPHSAFKSFFHCNI